MGGGLTLMHVTAVIYGQCEPHMGAEDRPRLEIHGHPAWRGPAQGCLLQPPMPAALPGPGPCSALGSHGREHPELTHWG